MKYVFFPLLLSASLFVTISCVKDDTGSIPLNGDYLPMQVNNYWEFQNNSQIAITGTKMIDGKMYSVFVQGSDTSFYRNVANKIYVRRSTGDESVKFDLSANVRGEWEYQDGRGTTWMVRLSSKTDTVVLNNTKIPNCYRFFFDIPMAVDDEHDILLAPGIGFVKMTCGECLYSPINLRKANINENEITFQ